LKEIKIEKININLKHISTEIAGEIVHGLPKKMCDEIVKQSPLGNSNSSIMKINEMDLGIIKSRRNPGTSYLQSLIVNQIGERLRRSDTVMRCDRPNHSSMETG
jgi:hypothetical protein